MTSSSPLSGRLTPGLRRGILIGAGLIFAIIHTITGWYWIPAFVSGQLVGLYWPLLLYTLAVAPLTVIGLVAGLSMTVAALLSRLRGSSGSPQLRWGLGVCFVALFFGAAGFPAVRSPLTDDSSVVLNQNGYHLAVEHDTNQESLLLFECDIAGVNCQEIYRSAGYAANEIDTAEILSDESRGIISVRACLVASANSQQGCQVIETYQQRLFK